MRILLTGAAGFIGTHIAAQARARGHEVLGVDAYLAAAHGPDVEPDPSIARRDLRTDDVDDLLTGIDVVCHQAAMVGNGVDAQDCRPTPSTTTPVRPASWRPWPARGSTTW